MDGEVSRIEGVKKTSSIDRRGFIGLSSAGFLGVLLGACGIKASNTSGGEGDVDRNCAPDNLVGSLKECVDVGEGLGDLHLAEIGASVERSRITDPGKQVLRETIDIDQDLDQSIKVLLYKEGVTSGVPQVIPMKDSNEQSVRYFLFVDKWERKPENVKNNIHEFFHIKQLEKLGQDLSGLDKRELEIDASYYGILAAVAWCQDNGISVSEYKPPDFSANMYAIVEKLDEAGMPPEASELYQFYADMEEKYTRTEGIRLATDYMATIDVAINLEGKQNIPNQDKISNLTKERENLIDLIDKYNQSIKETQERWELKTWSEAEQRIKGLIDAQFIPLDYYALKTSLSKVQAVAILLKGLTMSDSTISEEVRKLSSRQEYLAEMQRLGPPYDQVLV